MSQCGNTSQDLFEDSTHNSQDKGIVWRGVPLIDLKNKSIGSFIYPELFPNHSHSILFKLPLKNGEIPKPFPERSIDIWDEYHVRMPHSPKSLFPNHNNELKPRWTIVHYALERPISCSEELEKAIFSFNSKSNQKLTLSALHNFFSKTLDSSETEYFFENILPGIIQLALSLPKKISGGIPLLRKHSTKSISLSQDQISSLIANAFLCTFPRRNSTNHYNSFPRINFIGLFQHGDVRCVPEKIKCFVNYFRRIINDTPEGVITYTRYFIEPEKLPNWETSNCCFTKLHVSAKGTIEDEGTGLMEIDFANKFVGGGVLGRGSVQEEIKFVICPELIISKLLTECLDSSEALIVTGCERFNHYIGYGDTFTWAGDYIDSGNRDRFKRKFNTVVAIDATHYNNMEQQYDPPSLKRELNKAYVGFSFGSKEGWRMNIATGNWGCGAFNGEPRLKALLQLMAAAVAKRHVAYFTFQNEQLRDSIYDMHSFLLKNNITVGSLWKLIIKYTERRKQNNEGLYDFIYNELNKKDDIFERKSSPERNFYGNSEEKFHSEPPKATSFDKSKSQNPHLSLTKEVKLTDDEIALAMECAEEFESSVNSKSSNNPISAESYSIKTEEGKKRGIEIEKQRWKAYEIGRKELSLGGNPGNFLNNNSSETNGSPSQKLVKRKISDYFKVQTNE